MGPASGHTILLAEISLAEVAAALAAKHRAPRGISAIERDEALARFLQDCAQFLAVLRGDRAIIDIAVDLTQQYRLRGYDAVQLATALATNRDLLAGGRPGLVLVASDNDLLQAAQAEGLATDNPLAHPGLPSTPSP
jgi:predicted nucleic acid-binding protein